MEIFFLILLVFILYSSLFFSSRLHLSHFSFLILLFFYSFTKHTQYMNFLNIILQILSKYSKSLFCLAKLNSVTTQYMNVKLYCIIPKFEFFYISILLQTFNTTLNFLKFWRYEFKLYCIIGKFEIFFTSILLQHSNTTLMFLEKFGIYDHSLQTFQILLSNMVFKMF